MCQKEIHLIRQNVPALQIDILGMGGAKRNRQQLHAGLFGGAPGLMIVTTLAGGDHIHPAVFTTLTQRVHMIPGEQEMGELFAAIQTQILIAPEQGFIAQWWNIILSEKVFMWVLTERSDDGVDADHALAAADRIDPTMDLVKRFSQRVRDLVKCD
jgi:hypothetical protein